MSRNLWTLLTLPTACLCFLTAPAHADLAGLPAPAERVTATANKRVYTVGERINFIVTVRNTATAKVNVAFGAYPSNFQFDVLGPDGSKVKYTPYGHDVFDAIQGGSESVQTIAPGSERYVKANINDYYDMSVPGQYKITASREFPRRDNLDGYVRVTSNSVVVTVSPALMKPPAVNKQWRRWHHNAVRLRQYPEEQTNPALQAL